MPRRSIANLVYNGDFEYAPAFTAAGNVAQRWIDGTAAGSNTTKGEYGWAVAFVTGSVGVSFDPTVKRSGTYSLKLSTLDGTGATVVAQSKNSSGPTRWERDNMLQRALPSTSYTLTVWAKTSNVAANSVYADIREFDGAGTATATTSTAKLSGTSDWTQLTVTVTTNANTRYIGVLLRSNGFTYPSDAWFDDIVLTKTTPDTRLTATNRSIIQSNNASLYLAGSGSVSIASNASTLVIGDSTHRAYTWGGKFKIGPNTPTPTSTFFAKTSTKYPFQFRVETGKRVRVAVYDGSANPTVVSPKGIADNNWHTLIGVRNDNTISFYIDGLLVGTNTTTLADMNEASSISMASNGFIGNVSDAFFTFNAFTATDALNYHLKNSIPYSCLYRLPLNECAGSIAYDISGNGNNGTITSGSWSKDTPSKSRKAVSGNMVYNGDFEITPAVNVPTTTGDRYIDGTAGGLSTNGHGADIFGWYLWNYTTSYAAMFDTSVKRTGAASMKISTTATASTIGLRISVPSLGQTFKKINIPVLPNTSYTASGWIKTNLVSGSATTGARLQFVTNTGVSDVTTTTIVTGLVTTQDWTYYTATFTTAATARYITPVLQIVGNDGAGTLIMDAWFDDIQLYPTTAITRSAVT